MSVREQIAPDFAARLTHAMRAGNLSVRALCVEAGAFSPRTIFRWRAGATAPGIEALPILADVLGVDIDWLLGGDDGGPP